MEVALLQLMDGHEAARRLSMGESTLRKLRLLGTGPRFVKLGRMVRYRPADLDEWASQRVRNSTSEPAAA